VAPLPPVSYAYEQGKDGGDKINRGEKQVGEGKEGGNLAPTTISKSRRLCRDVMEPDRMLGRGG